MKYLLVFPAMLGIAVINPFTLKTSNLTASESGENTVRLDNRTAQSINSTKYADYYLTPVLQPELISREENDIFKLSLWR